METELDVIVNNSYRFTEWYGNDTLTNSEHIIITGFLCITGFLAIVGNVFVFLAVLIYPSLRTPTNLLLVGLLVTDLLMVAFCYPMTISATVSHKWPFGYHVCQLYGFGGMLVGYASIGMLMLISIDRYKHICKRDQDEDSLWKYYGLMILCVWLNAAVWAIMPVFGWSGYGIEPTKTACTISWWNNDPLFVSYVLTVFVLCYTIPILVMLYCYAKCINFISWVGGSSDQENIEWTNEKDITKMCFICLIGFILAWTPYAVICLWAAYGNPADIGLRSTLFPALCAKSSVIINPIVYVLTNRRFRTAFLALVKCQSNIEVMDAIPMKQIKATRNGSMC